MMNSYNGFGPGSFIGFGLFGLGMGLLGLLIIAIVLVLKGYSLWYAARRGEKGWFIALLIVNTFGILELIYLYFIVGKWNHKKVSAPHQNSSSTPNTPPVA
jgi:hypothetical protein